MLRAEGGDDHNILLVLPLLTLAFLAWQWPPGIGRSRATSAQWSGVIGYVGNTARLCSELNLGNAGRAKCTFCYSGAVGLHLPHAGYGDVRFGKDCSDCLYLGTTGCSHHRIGNSRARGLEIRITGRADRSGNKQRRCSIGADDVDGGRSNGAQCACRD